MSNEHKLCMSCMNVVPAGASACPKCGYNGTQRNPALCLPIGYRLAHRYVVGRKLNDNGDSVRYVAYDCVEKAVVELCEFLPRNGCMRGPDDFVLHPKYGAELHYKTALVDFCELYRNLRKLKNERSLVNTLDFLEANGTAYAVLERFENGVTLKEFLSLSGGTIAFEKCMTLLSPVLDAIDAIHSVNLIHRGVSPDTIYVNRNGDVKLGGFATSSVRTKDTEVAAKMQSGYSAPEQYSTTSWQNTQTDVYGIAATFYRCLTGTTPQDAEQRKSYDTLEAPIALNNAIPQYASRAIMLAMLVNMNERTRTAKDFKDMFNDRFADDSTREMEPRMIAVSTAKTKKTAIKAKPKNSKNRNRDVNEEQEKDGRGIRIAIVIVAVLAVLIGMFFVGKELLAEFDTQPDVIPVPTLT
ncbi:MAG: protein kinase, partial [Oscillospiraceae bacterium]